MVSSPPSTPIRRFADEQQILRTGRPVAGSIEKETMPDGRLSWVFTSKVPLYDKQGSVIGTVGINPDITDRRQAEEQLNRVNADLARRQYELVQALADLKKSHEELQVTQLQLIQTEKLDSLVAWRPEWRTK